MRRSSTLRTIAFFCGWAFTLTPAAAETEVGDFVVSGEAEIGGRVVTGDDWGAGKWGEYEQQRPGLIGSGHFLAERADGSLYVRGLIDFVDEDDQRYELEIGRWGHYGLELEYKSFPHNYTSNSLTPYDQGMGGALHLPPGCAGVPGPGCWDYETVKDGNLGDELDRHLTRRDLGFTQLEGRVAGFWKPNEFLELNTSYRIQDKSGNQPNLVMFSFSSFVNIAQPIKEQIHEFSTGANFTREDFSFSVDYLGSFYDNDLSAVTIDNPLQDVDENGTPQRGRKSLAPDNSAHQITFSAGSLVPTAFPSRLAASVSYGIRLQDQDFKPYTINTALVTGAGPASHAATLPQSSLNGEVRTILANLVYTARPIDALNIKARYRLYDFDNDSDRITFDDRVPRDNSVVTGVRSTRTDFTRQNGNLETAYQLAKLVTLKAGFEWESWSRSNTREVRHSNELSGSFGFEARPNRRLRLSAGTTIGDRDGTYHTMGTQLPELRRYDQADRFRIESLWRALWVARDDLSLGMNGGLTVDDYDASAGLTDAKRWNIGFDADYAPLDWLSLSAWYTFDYIRLRQASATAPDQIWKSRSKDTGHNFGLDLNAVLVPGVLDARVGYVYQKGEAKTTSRAPNDAAAAGNPVNYPTIEDTMHQITTELTWHALESLDLIGAYRFEDWRHENFQTDPLGTNLGDNHIYLNDRIDDYTAHVFTISARYEF